MARKPVKSELGDRLRSALRENQSTRSREYERTFFDGSEGDNLADLGVVTEEEQRIARDRGEVFGAATGRGARAIQAEDLEDIQWDPARAYPQIQTHSSNPERPRTIAAGYDPENAILRITFRNGVTYEYLGVNPRVWSTFQRAPSPGMFIDQVLNQYPYRPMEVG